MTPSPSVLFIAIDAYAAVGGMQRFNRRVVAGLAAIAAETGGPQPRVRLMRDRPEQLPTDSGADLAGFAASRLGFVRATLAAARRSDVLLLGHVNLLPLAVAAKAVAPRLRVGLFVHGVEVWNDPAYRRRKAYEPLILRAVDRIAAVSRHTAAIMAREFHAPGARFGLFPNAVDALEPPPASGRGTTFLVVTRLAAHDRGKHVDAVLKAFAVVAAGRPDAVLEIVGDGVLRPELEALAATLGIAGQVRFLGRVSDDDLRAAYARAGAFVLPSSKEGFGIVYLEAWQYGLPVICGSEGASKEIVADGDDGFVCDPADIAGLAARMESLLADPAAAAAMGARGRAKVTAQYLDAGFRRNLAGLLAALAPRS